MITQRTGKITKKYVKELASTPFQNVVFHDENIKEWYITSLLPALLFTDCELHSD